MSKMMVLLTPAQIQLAITALDHFSLEVVGGSIGNETVSEIQEQVLSLVQQEVHETMHALSEGKEPGDNVADFRKRF